MTYTIKVRVYQTSTNAVFRIVEKDTWHYANGGTWADIDDYHILTMGGSGTSGMLRFMDEEGEESFYVAMGVHNYVRWVDIVTDLGSTSGTNARALSDYYNGQSEVRVAAREAQR